ncbi:MAG: sulfatase-modifying factor protein [Acidobacteria bacterium]|nr:MAG: sulfatase-modifying factor protein [Acidobacteriota bacterium]
MRNAFLFALCGLAAIAAHSQPPASYTETVPGTKVSFEMVAVPGGRFTMGSPDNEKGRAPDEGPEHEVEVGPFWIGKTEVTWDEYDLFAFGMDLERPSSAQPRPATPTGADAITRPTPPYGDESFGYGKGKQPAINMTWHAAMEYCRWLSAKTGKLYRLATEAEWEYAARAGTKTAYSFGDDPRALGDYAWTRENSGERPHPVASKKPNAWGLYDMHGNVAEWILDQYDPAYYRGVKPMTVGPVLLPGNHRFPHVSRGGSWDDDAKLARSAARRGSTPEWSRRDPQSPKSIWWHTDATFAGFRVVRAVAEQDNLKGFHSTITRDSPQ